MSHLPKTDKDGYYSRTAVKFDIKDGDLTAIVEGPPYPSDWTPGQIEDYKQRLRNFGAEPLDEKE